MFEPVKDAVVLYRAVRSGDEVVLSTRNMDTPVASFWNGTKMG